MEYSIYSEIEDVLRERRQKASDEAEQRRMALYARLPEVERIDNIVELISVVGACRKLSREPVPYVRERVCELYPELLSMDVCELLRLRDELEQRKADILQSERIDAGTCAPVYFCPVCSDTGRNDGSFCACYRVLMSDRLRRRANLSADGDTFDKFDLSLYAEKPDAERYGVDASPREHMRGVYKHCMSFVERFGNNDTPNLLFVGPAGVGKTFMSNCIASALLERGVPVLYMPVSMLFKPFAASAFAADDERVMLNELKRMILSVELLIIDDLGTEKQSATRYEEVLEILNTREINDHNRPCKTIITTNMTPRNLYDDYGERVASRLLGSFDLLRFCGDDIRLKQKLSRVGGTD